MKITIDDVRVVILGGFILFIYTLLGVALFSKSPKKIKKSQINRLDFKDFKLTDCEILYNIIRIVHILVWGICLAGWLLLSISEQLDFKTSLSLFIFSLFIIGVWHYNVGFVKDNLRRVWLWHNKSRIENMIEFIDNWTDDVRTYNNSIRYRTGLTIYDLLDDVRTGSSRIGKRSH